MFQSYRNKIKILFVAEFNSQLSTKQGSGIVLEDGEPSSLSKRVFLPTRNKDEAKTSAFKNIANKAVKLSCKKNKRRMYNELATDISRKLSGKRFHQVCPIKDQNRNLLSSVKDQNVGKMNRNKYKLSHTASFNRRNYSSHQVA